MNICGTVAPYSSERNEKKFNNINILLLDGDPIYLSVVSKMMRESGYKVITAKRAGDAFCILREREHLLDLVLADAQLPDMDKYQFLETMARVSQLPVIMMSSDRDENGILGSLYKGAEFHLVKPLTYSDVQSLWQFSVLRKIKLNRFASSSSSSSDQGMNTSAAESRHIFGSISLGSNDDDDDSGANHSSGRWSHYYGSKRKQPENSSSRSSDENFDSSIVKKNKIVWTHELHNKFLQAIDFLGADEAFPKKILQHMNVPGLRKEHISSHLQKYRLALKREQDEKFYISPNLGLYMFSSNLSNMDGGIYQSPGSQKGIPLPVLPEINNIFKEQNFNPANLQAATSVGRLFGAPAANFDVCQLPSSSHDAAKFPQMSSATQNLVNFSNMISGPAAAPLDYGYALENSGTDYNKNNNNNNMIYDNNNNIGTINGGVDFEDQLIDESIDWRAMYESAMGEELTPVPQPQPVAEEAAVQPVPIPHMLHPVPMPQIAQPTAAEVASQPSNVDYDMFRADRNGGVDGLFNMLKVTNNFFYQDFNDLL